MSVKSLGARKFNTKIISLLFFSTILLSCKKDKLKNEKEILVGTWNWIKTVKETDLCNPPSIIGETNPQIEGSNYSITFLEKGKVIFSQNDSEIEAYKIVFALFGGSACDYLSGYTYYGIDLDNNEEMDLDGCLSDDTLIVIRGYPFPDPADGCKNYTSYFVKE